ncbi:serine/threonine-protein kinase [Microtetraspora fusca]|uniref:serine/threonine-protein kinase n=1 Tax=Microtetraspora fusca TaxID=1997 RepID=UPI000AB284D7|nr:serine/threonine-protein kinase [Microtetraspora fusca]
MTTDHLLGMVPSMPEGQGPIGGGTAGPVPEGQGRLVGRRYRLLSPVGRGGMGMVWHAHDVLLDRDVAVKELLLPFGLDQAGLHGAHQRMLREARSAARLSHPGIVTVHDVVEEDGRPWIVMELVRAWSLEQAVRQSGPLPVVQAAEIGVRVLDALRHAHAAGILHRDVKPGNVLLTADRVVLTDFGIAAIEGDVTITQTGLLMGSPAYIPPERLQGRPITHAADLWSFGATLYAAVEGHPPYEGADAVAVLGAVLTREPARPRRAGALLPVIQGLLRKNPADRIGAAQVADMLERVLRTHGAGGSTPGHRNAMPTPQDSTPAQLLPPFDVPSGPLPSRIIETPSGPIRVPADPLASPSGPYSAGHTSGAHRWDAAASAPGGAAGPAGDATGGHTAPPRDPLAAPVAPLPVRRGTDGASVPFGSSPPMESAPFDPLTMPSGSMHAPERRAEAWPVPGPSDLPGQLGVDPDDPFTTGPGRVRRRTEGAHSRPEPDPGTDTKGSRLSRMARRSRGSRSADGSATTENAAAEKAVTGAHAAPEAAEKAATGMHAGPETTGKTATGMHAGPETTGKTATGAYAGPEAAEAAATAALTAGDTAAAPPGVAGPARSGGRQGGRRRAGSRRQAGERTGRSTILIVVAALAVVAVIVTVVLLILPGGSADKGVRSAGQPSAAPMKADSADGADGDTKSGGGNGAAAGFETPKGYAVLTGGGVSVAVPKGWRVSTESGATTFAGPKDSAQSVVVRKIADGGLGALKAAEQRAKYDDYTQVRLGEADYRWPAAEWEYTYTASGQVTMHRIIRYIEAGGQAYSVAVTSPDYDWNDSAASVRKAVWGSFAPA